MKNKYTLNKNGMFKKIVLKFYNLASYVNLNVNCTILKFIFTLKFLLSKKAAPSEGTTEVTAKEVIKQWKESTGSILKKMCNFKVCLLLL